MNLEGSGVAGDQLARGIEQRLQLDRLAKVHKASRKAIIVALVAEATRLLKRGRKLCALNDAAGK